jgi:hypothetical protein
MISADRNGFETVHTVTASWDGPRIGIADCGGLPHAFESLFENGPDGSGFFLLQAIDTGTFQLAMEAWAIWCRWEEASRTGQTTVETHPALPADRARRDELEAILEPRLRVHPAKARRLRGRFEACMPMAFGAPTWAICWLPEEEPADPLPHPDL